MFCFFFLCSVVGALTDYQSDINKLQDQDGNTPLHLACRNGHLEAARKLFASHLLFEKYARAPFTVGLYPDPNPD